IDLQSTSSVLTNGDLIQVDHSATYTTTKALSANLLDLSRNLITDTGGDLTVTGAVATFANTGTQTAGTLTDSSSLLFLDQNYAASTGPSLYIDTESTAGPALVIESASTVGQTISVTSDPASSGILQQMSADGLTTGKMMNLGSSSGVLTSGDLLNVSHNATYSTDKTLSGSIVDFSRSLTTDTGGQTLTLSGALATFSNTGSQNAGTLADSANVIFIDQNYAASTGAVLRLDTDSTGGSAILVTADAMTTANTLSMSVDGLTTGSALDIQRANGGTDYSDTTEGLAYIAQLDSASTGHVLHIKNSGAGGYAGYFDHVGLGSSDAVLKVIAESGGDNATEGINGFIASFNNMSYSAIGDGGLDTREGIYIQACQNTNPSTACDLLEFHDGNGTLIGSVHGDGAGGVTYATGAADYAELFPGDRALLPEGTIAGLATNGNVISAISDESMIGVRSMAPSVLGGASEDPSDMYTKVPVGLLGQVMVRVNMEGGVITAGDYITISSTPGVGRKATGSGKVVGQALGSTNGEGLIKVFVSPQWRGENFLASDGSPLEVPTDLILASVQMASAAAPSVDSGSLILRGTFWNGESAGNRDMVVSTDVTDSGDYQLAVKNTNDELLASIGNDGDLALAGNLYPSDRGTLQTEKYIYYDGSQGAGGNTMRTNASGWASDSSDFAEMFPAFEPIAAGEVVIFGSNDESVARSTGATYDQKIAGVVSTQPGFLAGSNKSGNVPVALVGRVPTFVSGENGAILPGDPLTTSSKPGYAMKATESGMIVGYAMENFSGDTGSITVYIRPSYFNNGDILTDTPAADNSTSGLTTASTLNLSQMHDLAGGTLKNVGSMSGLAGAWTISENGDFVTDGRYISTINSYQNEPVETYATLSRESTIELSGVVNLQNGFAEVKFEDVDPKFNDIISNTAPYRVFITPEGVSGQLYVGSRTLDGFIISEVGGSSTVAVDWLVIAYHKDFAPDPEEFIPEDNIATEEAIIPEDIPAVDSGAEGEDDVVTETEEDVAVTDDQTVEEETSDEETSNETTPDEEAPVIEGAIEIDPVIVEKTTEPLEEPAVLVPESTEPIIQ
ncbi:MAG: hypothetical protein WC730_03350, partial [Patescibacteria group bacterium]